MKNFIKKHIPFLMMCLVLLTMIVFLIVFSILKTNVKFAEDWTRNVSRSYVSSLGRFNAAFPFSISEVSIIVVAISSIIFLAWGFSLLGNRKVWPFIHRVMMVVLIIVGCISVYNFSVGAAYNRAPLELELYEGEIKKEEFVDIATYFVEDCNKCLDELELTEQGEVVLPYTKESLVERIRIEYEKLNSDYYNEYTPYAKPMFTSPIYTAFGIIGVYFGVLGEANYNTNCTNAELPFLMAHEMAHGKGVMREDDAQMLALNLCLNSSDPLFRYSAYYNTLSSILAITKLTGNKDDYTNVRNKIDDKVFKNFNYIYEHWKGKMFMYDLGDKINDWYLKTFGQKEGTTSYSDTPTDVDESGNVISLSNYQSLYFKIYYNQKS